MNSPEKKTYQRVLGIGVGIIIIIALGVMGYEHFVLKKAVAPAASILSASHQYHKGSVEVGGKVVHVDLAKTAEEQRQGLSGRKGLTPDTGMLFVFEMPAQYGFWMKDMLFPIDMIWINSKNEIVHIEKNASPDSYPKIFEPTTLATYVLEVQAGFSDAHHLKLGDKVTFLKGI